MRYRVNEIFLLSALTALVVSVVLASSARLFAAPVRVSELGLLKWLGAVLLIVLFAGLLRKAVVRERK